MRWLYYNEEDAAYCFYCIKGFQQNKLRTWNFEYGKHLHINRLQNWKEATTRFPKARYAVNNNMSVVHIFIINNVQQPASYICISVEHHWFSLLIRCNSDPESLKHDMSLMNT